jgi:hypothetical protein
LTELQLLLLITANLLSDKPSSASQAHLWEKFVCIPSQKCSGIKDISDFKENSLSERIIKENEEKAKEEKKVKEKEDDMCNNCQKNRTEMTRAATQINFRPSTFVGNPTLPNRAKSSNNLSLRSRSKLGLVYKIYTDEDEDEDSMRKDTSGKLFRPRARFDATSSSSTAQETASRAQSSAAFNSIPESPEVKRLREIKSAHVQRSVQIISPAVKLCYTQGDDPSRICMGAVAGLIHRSKTMSDINGDPSKQNGPEYDSRNYDRCKSTSSESSSQDKTFVTNLKSKFTKNNQFRSRNKPDDDKSDVRSSSRYHSVKKHMSKLAKRREQANNANASHEFEVPPLTLVLRKYSNESETEIDARLKRVQGIESKLKLAHSKYPKSEHSVEKQNGGLAKQDPVPVPNSDRPPDGGDGEYVSVRFLPSGEVDVDEDAENQGKNAIFPIGEILPDETAGNVVPPNGVKFHPYRHAGAEIDRDMKVTGRDLLVHHEESLIQDGFDVLDKDKYGLQRVSKLLRFQIKTAAPSSRKASWASRCAGIHVIVGGRCPILNPNDN